MLSEKNLIIGSAVFSVIILAIFFISVIIFLARQKSTLPKRIKRFSIFIIISSAILIVLNIFMAYKIWRPSN